MSETGKEKEREEGADMRRTGRRMWLCRPMQPMYCVNVRGRTFSVKNVGLRTVVVMSFHIGKLCVREFASGSAHILSEVAPSGKTIRRASTFKYV